MGKKKQVVKEQEETVVKEHRSIDSLLISANYILRAYDAIFQTSHHPEVKNHGDTISIMFFDMALVYLKHADDGVTCVMSAFDECNVILIAEFVSMLKDIFGNRLYINDETYIHDPSGESLIWGRERIDKHNELVWGRKVKHTLWFADDLAGHS